MKYKIQYKDFLKTFTKKQLQDIKDYVIVMKLHKRGYSRSQIRQKIDVSLDKLHQWRNTKIKPIPIKILEETKRRNYFNEVSKENLELLAYLVGYNLGDGNISRNLCNSWFYGVNSDLEKIKRLLIKFKVSPVIYTYKINNGKMAVHDRIFSRFLVCFGAVIGDKTKTKVEVPKWILNSKKASKLKLRFLQGFFDSELSNIKQTKNRPLSYSSLKLYTSKQKDYTREGKFFFEQIKFLLKEFNVCSSKIKFDRSYIRGRDGGQMQQLYFIIYSNYVNLYNFIKNIGFLYNAKRRKSSLKTLTKIKSKAECELNKIKHYKKALKMRKKGLSAYKIAEKLNLELYHIKNWIYFNRKPSLYNFIENF